MDSTSRTFYAIPIYQDLRGAPGRIRTCDARFRKPTLYPLSYGSRRPTLSAGSGGTGRYGGVAQPTSLISPPVGSTANHTPPEPCPLMSPGPASPANR
jgi:hypothetical protein